MSAAEPGPPPLDHGAVGNGRILALISPTTAVEWLCMPRFDSPSVFARLLDRERGGCLRILVDGAEVRGRLSYLRNTNVLSTVIDDGVHAFEVVDFAPWLPRAIGHMSLLHGPRRYTHVGLINAAMTIGDLLEARDGRVGAWAHRPRQRPDA